MEAALGIYAVTAVLTFAVSFVFAMLGLGGGMLYVPIFVWLGFPLKAVAIPVGLLLNGLNTLLAFLRYVREGLVDFAGGTPAALAALVLAPLGAHMVGSVPRDTLLLLFALAVLAAGARALWTSKKEGHRAMMPLKKRAFAGAVAGGFAGFSGGLLGLGGGFIVGPVLMEMGYRVKKAAATTAFIVTFSSFSGFLGHMAEGRMDPALAAVTTVAVLAGSQLGAWYMTNRARPSRVKGLYGVVLLLVGLKLLASIS